MSDFVTLMQQLMNDNAAANQSLARIPEPDSLTEGLQNVTEYNQLLKTNMTSNYANVMSFVERCCPSLDLSQALDICSGPGLFAKCLIENLNIKSLTGIDLSSTMIEAAETNRKNWELERELSFQLWDAAQIRKEFIGSFDLVTFINSAHHFERGHDLSRVIENCEQYVKADGLIVISDLSRLKSEDITQRFVHITGQSYGEAMFQDFLNSMRAAWLPVELSELIPAKTQREWFHVYPSGLPFLQVLVSLPKGDRVLFKRASRDWLQTPLLGHEEARAAWEFTTQVFSTSVVHKLEI